MDPTSFDNSTSMNYFSEESEKESDKKFSTQDDYHQLHETDVQQTPNRVPYSDELASVREIQRRNSIESNVMSPSVNSTL